MHVLSWHEFVGSVAEIVAFSLLLGSFGKWRAGGIMPTHTNVDNLARAI